MKLLSATPSPYARKARIALHEKGLPFELVTEVPWNQDAGAPEHNPLGKIPVLLLDDGECVYESRLIVEYLELHHPDPALVPASHEARLAHLRVEALCDGLCDAAVLIVIERTRPAHMQSDHWIARQHGKIDRALDALESHLSPGATFALGDAFGLADIAMGSAAGFIDLRLPEIDWRASHPRLDALSRRLEDRESFRKTVPSKQRFRDRIA